MSVECIHGLDDGLCDQCFPKPVPEAVAAASGAPRRTAPATLTATRTRPKTRVAPVRTPQTRATAAAPFHVGEQRIYHLTHVRNLASILSDGELRANATPTVDISSPANRQARSTTTIAAGAVADYVPFFLAPNSKIWELIRTDETDPRLSTDIRGAIPANFVLLVSTVAKAGLTSTVVADGDAIGPLTRFGTTPEDNERMLRRLHNDEVAIAAAEFLVEQAFPFEAVTLIGVAHAKARDEVKAILAPSGYAPKVSVYPPWFQRPEA